MASHPTTLQWTRRFDNDWKLDARLGGGQSSRALHSPVPGRNAAGDEVLNQLADAHCGPSKRIDAGVSPSPTRPTTTWPLAGMPTGASATSSAAAGSTARQSMAPMVSPTAPKSPACGPVRPGRMGGDAAVVGLRRPAHRAGLQPSQPDGGLGQASFRVTTPAAHGLQAGPQEPRRDPASLTRSYRAPELGQLLAVPRYDVLRAPLNGPNTPDVADSSGNPGLKPELATGLDLAFEKYLPSGGLVSVSAFHRRIEGLFRQQVTLESVPWSPVKRWVSRPVNYAAATTTGLELEVQGPRRRPAARPVRPFLGLELRTSVGWYRSSVEGVQGPNNRLAGQQPHSLTLGFDHRPKGLPLSWGGSVYYARIPLPADGQHPQPGQPAAQPRFLRPVDFAARPPAAVVGEQRHARRPRHAVTDLERQPLAGHTHSEPFAALGATPLRSEVVSPSCFGS